MFRRSDPSENHFFLQFYHFCLVLPLLAADDEGDIDEHEGVDDEHDQDRTCDRGDARSFIFYISRITK